MFFWSQRTVLSDTKFRMTLSKFKKRSQNYCCTCNWDTFWNDTSITALCHCELSWMPTFPGSVRAGHHDYATMGGVSTGIQGTCIIPNCKSRPKTMCLGCTRDVEGIVWVCAPKDGKTCWEKLHQARSAETPRDADGNEIPRPKLIQKRRRNSSLGTHRIPEPERNKLCLNPHHVG